MKKFFLASLILISLQSFSQISLSSTDFPTDGNSYVVSTLSDAGAIDYTSTGANFTWDFSQIVPQSQDTIAFVSASNSSLPGTYIVAFNNFITDPEHDADVANYQDYESPMPTITFEDFYGFYSFR